MSDFLFHNCGQDIKNAGENAVLIKKPVDPSTGKEYNACSYAFMPGCRLCAAEPEIVIKAYDSLRFQNPDTAVFIQFCGDSDINGKWEELGRPTMVTACMTCLATLKKTFPHIPVISLYEFLQKLEISGGCNSEDYILSCSDDSSDEAKTAVAGLAESMGVKLHKEEDGSFPYITDCIDRRDTLKNRGNNAVHILELIYGMGASNTHMIHEHDHDHDGGDHAAVAEDCDGNCAQCSAPCGEAPSAPAPLPTEDERLTNMKELTEAFLMLFWS